MRRPTVIRAGDGPRVHLASLGARFVIEAGASEGRFALVEHPLPPRSLGAPRHRHSREDEYSFVLAGRMGAELGGEVVYGEPGDLVLKPRGQWHAFWNAGDEPARILEIISPGGLERYFAEAASLSPGPDLPRRLGELAARYGLEFDRDSVRTLIERHGLRPPPQ